MSEVKKTETETLGYLSLLLGHEITNETPLTQVEIAYIDSTFGEMISTAKRTLLLFDGSAPYVPKNSENKVIALVEASITSNEESNETSDAEKDSPVKVKTAGDLFREKFGQKSKK